MFSSIDDQQRVVSSKDEILRGGSSLQDINESIFFRSMVDETKKISDDTLLSGGNKKALLTDAYPIDNQRHLASRSQL